ncbi:MAG: TfoX/Sxy family protein [Candidatus Veblenbacteria bacterium]|nr:TfoX/Sxy family protein [Candidatus Veblenbacteria bacterium]
MKHDSFRDYVTEQLAGLPQLTVRPMFSGYGLYSGERFFGIISSGQLFFKTNSHTRAKFQATGMKPFAPSADQVLKNYYEVPPEVLEDKVELVVWAQEASGLGVSNGSN